MYVCVCVNISIERERLTPLTAPLSQPLFAVQAGLAAGMLVCLVSEALGGRWFVPTQREGTRSGLTLYMECPT